MLTLYSYTLFVDPSGVSSTAVVGDYTKPWQTINDAIAYANTSSQPTGGYTIHIFRGNYTETSSVTFGSNKSISLFFEPNANLDVTLGSVGYWFNHDGGTASVNISGSGKSINYISSNYGVFKVGSTSQVSPNSLKLSIHDIRISSSDDKAYSSTGNGVVISSTRSTVNIDNSTVNLTTPAPTEIINQYVIWLSAGYINILDSTLEMSSQTGSPTIITDTGSAYGWLIWEDLIVSSPFSGAYDAGRIKLQNTYLSQYGSGGGGAIRSYGNDYVVGTSTFSIFLANVYFRCTGAKMQTIYAYPKQDSVWLGGSVISGGIAPDNNIAPQSNRVYQYPTQATNLAIYNVVSSNMPRPY